ncbi:hypothetical protein GCM10009617_32200 [Leifsonia poae]|uniref:Uncharacterized protein n=1 Tax=Leifsonia poae TaxID=110933 RepID=A0A9W6H9H2_9MICO|nr:hypothetical protein GCM10017584_17660 [Leifsonia poae]
MRGSADFAIPQSAAPRPRRTVRDLLRLAGIHPRRSVTGKAAPSADFQRLFDEAQCDLMRAGFWPH